MASTGEGDEPGDIFALAVQKIKDVQLRPELVVSEIAAPKGLAPNSFALAADLAIDEGQADPSLGTGRFILLYSPDEPETWGGPMRVICFAQAPLEPEIGIDPFLADVTWSWLIDALEAGEANYYAESGTATKILSTGFGELAEQGDGALLELRASWTPTDDKLDAHVTAWMELLCMLAGLPPKSEGVSLLSAIRARHG